MKKKTVTKHALLASILAMVLCVTMLVGTTFAWFTDTASAKVNQIKSGKLDVDIVDAGGESLDGKELKFLVNKAIPAEGTQILWEPGCTYQLQPFKVKNAGNLALKYKIVISGINGDAELNKAIEWTMKIGEEDIDASADYVLLEANACSKEITISGHMKESAGNEYMDKSIDGIAVTVLATQKDAEFDSTRQDYDKNAEYPEAPIIMTEQDNLNSLITGSEKKTVSIILPKTEESFTLDNGVAHEGDKSRDVTFTGDGTQTIDVVANAVGAEGGQLNYQRGSTFTFENLTIQAGEGSYDGIVCDELVYKNCTIKGKLTLYGKATFINCKFENTMADQYSIWTWGGTDVTFEDCTFNTNGKAILLYGQATEAKPTNLVVNNCTFNDRNNGAAGKAAIEIGNDYNATYTLTVNEATVNGFADGKNTGSKLWANKNSMDAAHLTVTIDGTKVQ